MNPFNWLDALLAGTGPLLVVHDLWLYGLIAAGAFIAADILFVIIDVVIFSPVISAAVGAERGKGETQINIGLFIFGTATGAIYSLSQAFHRMDIIFAWFAVVVGLFVLISQTARQPWGARVANLAIVLVANAIEVVYWVGLTILFLHFIVLA